MPNTTVSIEIPEAQVAKVIKALCKRGDRPETGAEAKAQLIVEVKRWVVEEGHREAAIEAPELK